MWLSAFSGPTPPIRRILGTAFTKRKHFACKDHVNLELHAGQSLTGWRLVQVLVLHSFALGYSLYGADRVRSWGRLSAKVKVDAWRCERCGHIWVPRVTTVRPETCPRCKSPYWNRPRRVKAAGPENN